jgi:hypothetical protein
MTNSSNNSQYKHIVYIKALFDKLIIPSTGGVIAWLAIIFLCGMADIVVFALQSNDYSQFQSIVGAGFLIAGAFFISGILIGFIFGIPRIMSQESSYLEASNTESTLTKRRSYKDGLYGENSNLDQISDWLTKILVAIGLTQLTQIPGALEQYAKSVELALGGFPSSNMFSIAILIFFSLDGFLIGYLWTRRSAAVEFHKGAVEQLQDSTAV